jgi:DNA-binding transcriptional ArsR family regulator
MLRMTEIIHHNQYKAFANSERVQLILCLKKPKSVTELLESCTLSQSALSQHLKVLRDTGMVDTEREGRNIIYKVDNKKVLRVAALLLDITKK